MSAVSSEVVGAEGSTTVPRTKVAKQFGHIIAQKTSMVAEKTIWPTPATRLSRRIVALGKQDPDRSAYFFRLGYMKRELNDWRKAKLTERAAPAEATLQIRHDSDFAERFTRSLLTNLCGVEPNQLQPSALHYLVSQSGPQDNNTVAARFNTSVPGASLEFDSPAIRAGMGNTMAMPLNIIVRG